jgi:4'-phosphopantetheinyl transferase EntD
VSADADLLRELFGQHGGLALARHRRAGLSDDLFAAEETTMARAPAQRRHEFAAGRAAARLALARLGHTPVAIDRDADGVPAWPQGFVGSIAHCDGEAVAIVGRADRAAALGIDVEPAAPIDEATLRLVCNDRDRVLRDKSLPLPVAWGNIVFSAKEAVYKAVFPRVRRFLDFDAVAIAIARETDAAGRFTIVAVDEALAATGIVDAAQGRWAVRDGLLFCSVLVAAPPPSA